MKIGLKYKIESDNMNVTIHRRGKNKKTGADTWTAVAYYGTVPNALKGLVDLEVNETELKDFRTVVAKQEELYQLIGNLKGGE